MSLTKQLTEFFNSYDEKSGMMRGYSEPEIEDVVVEHIEQHGGEEQGRDYWSVWKFHKPETNETCYIKFYGWYASHCGSEYEGWNFVTPKEVTVTEYV